MRPFASASIGQVHKAITKEGLEVAVKIQYPGVADSIESDMDNLLRYNFIFRICRVILFFPRRLTLEGLSEDSLLSFSGMLPPGMYLDKTLAVTKQELLQETDYLWGMRGADDEIMGGRIDGIEKARHSILRSSLMKLTWVQKKKTKWSSEGGSKNIPTTTFHLFWTISRRST
jgi:hypothetical protein